MQTKQPSKTQANRSGPSAAWHNGISAWTTNSLITVMLVVIALGFGREVLHWWHDDKTSLAAPGGDPLGDGAAPHVLEFGDQAWSIRRQEFTGRPAEVAVALQAACRAAMADSRPRGESPDAAERELLKRLARERPVAEDHGQWRLYQWGAGHSVLIGTRAVGVQGQAAMPESGAEETGRAKAHPTTVGTSLADTPYRVVIWGVAVPAPRDAWTLYLFQLGGAVAAKGSRARRSRCRRAGSACCRYVRWAAGPSSPFRRTMALRREHFLTAGLPRTVGRSRPVGSRLPPAGTPASRRLPWRPISAWEPMRKAAGPGW